MANKPNYPAQMDQVFAALGDERPPLLLHACCGPCSSSVLEVLCAHFQVTVLYYNPNIWPPEEYRRRADELAVAMECRCYHGGEGRTRLRQLKYTAADRAVIVLFLVMVVVTGVLGHFGL